MSTQLPGQISGNRILVFGTDLTAQVLGTRLRTNGFDVHYLPGDTVPEPHAPGALEILRSLLKKQLASTSGAPCFVHPAAHPWGLRPELSQLGAELGLVVLAPPSSSTALFSNRLNLIGLAESLGVPHLVLSFEPISSPRELERFILQQGLSFPIVLRSVRPAGAFDTKMLQPTGIEDMESSLSLWMEQLRKHCGEPMIYPERYLDDARQISVPFVRFSNGEKHIFPLVDSSLQSRNQEIVQFCPPQGLSEIVSTKMCAWVSRLAEESRYVGIGSFHFLVAGQKAFLVDGLSRLDDGFLLWEKIDGTDALEWQLAATSIAPTAPSRTSHPDWQSGQAGMMLGILAEDPMLQLPQPGVVHEISAKASWEFPGARAEFHCCYEPGEEISSTKGSVIARLLAGGQNMKQALGIGLGVLKEIWISGSLQTNERFLGEILAHPWVNEGMFHRGFIDEEFIPRMRPDPDVLAIMGSLPMVHPETLSGSASAPQGRWAAGDQWITPNPSKIAWAKGPDTWKTQDMPGVSGMVRLPDGQTLRATAYPILPMPSGKWQVRLGPWFLRVRRILRENKHPQVLSLVSGRVHAVLFREGAIVPAHEPFLIIESLGYLVPHSSPRDLEIHSWRVRAEQPVRAGESLAEVGFSVTSE